MRQADYETDYKTTVSLNGGPPVSVNLEKAAAALLKRRTRRDDTQTDLEDDALGGRDAKNGEKVEQIAADRLRSLIERIERLEEEKKELAGDIKDIYAETRSAGFDVKVVRALVALRKKEPAEVEAAETLLDLYRRALGM